ncbi:MAG: MgtC/SapB family protein [Planctomycetaceae bacterium]|nr:MgtC/SapB family protein [Planctomycetaceae bacterium]
MTLSLSTAELLSDLGRVALASLLGGAVGIERRLQAQPPGMRTQMLIAAACCVAMQISLFIPRLEPHADAARIAQSVLQGIGFIGAGAILKTGLSVHGVTTAGSIWASATIGLAVGAGLPVHAATLALLATLGLVMLEPLEALLTRRRELRRIVVESGDGAEPAGDIDAVLKKYRIRVDELGMTRNQERRRVIRSAVAACPEKLPVPELVAELSRLPGVIEVRLE